MNALLLLVLLTVAAVFVSLAMRYSTTVDPEDDEDEDDADGTDIYTPATIDVSDESGVWLRERMGWRVGDRTPRANPWKVPVRDVTLNVEEYGP